jgi:tetratricopeptide (TPR) repeat protein
MNRKTYHCTDPGLFESLHSGSNFEEARAILLGMYSEKELNPSDAAKIQDHVEQCSDCRQYLEELQKINAFLSDNRLVPYAVCPSSNQLDRFVNTAADLPLSEQNRISKHLNECPLCKDEVQWLKALPRAPDNIGVTNWRTYAAPVAAALLLMISIALVWQTHRSMIPGDQLRALAVIKEPEQIDFQALEQTAPPLPEKSRQQFEHAVEQFRSKNYQEAARLLEDTLREQPTHSASLFLLGYSYYKLGRPEKAFDLCDRAEQMFPKSMERCLFLVNVALKTGHFERAVAEIAALHHDAPDHPEVKQMYEEIQSLTRGRLIRL